MASSSPAKKKRMKQPVVQAAAPAAPVAPAAAPANPQQAVLMLVLGFISISLLLFSAMQLVFSGGEKPSGPVLLRPVVAEPSADAAVHTESVQPEDAARPFATDAVFAAWLNTWKTVEPNFTVQEFAAAGASQPIAVLGEPVTPAAQDLEPPVTSRYVWSPDHARFADYLSSFGEPDAKVTVWSAGSGTVDTVAFCGTACTFDAASWLDADRLAVYGVEEETTPYRRLAVTVFDFAKGERQSYTSAERVLPVNPHDAAKALIWSASVPSEEAEPIP